MKYETAIRNAVKVADRIRGSNGLIGTPECERDTVKIRKAWLFGSTAKGKPNPSDVDILIEYDLIGRRQHTNCRAHRGFSGANAAVDKESKRRYGMSLPKSSWAVTAKFLTNNMKMIRIHNASIDGEIAHPRIMIYPRMDLTIPSIKTSRSAKNG